MMFLVRTMPRSDEAVHTSDLVNNNKIYIKEKDSIIMLCGYYDTG